MNQLSLSSASSIPVVSRKGLASALLLFCAGVTSQLHAQVMDYGSLEALFGEPVTTSVTGSPQRASDVPATMVIITAEQIRRSGAVDIPDVLQQVIGVDVLRWTTNSTDVGVRGYNKAFSPRQLVLVNGRQVYADYYGLTSWSSLPVELGEIRQIEVVKGPNSALFGFNAVGGVINIITFSPRDDDLNFVELRAGTQDHMQFSGASTFALGDKGAMRVTAGVRENDDFDTPVNQVNEGTRLGDTRESVRVDIHYDLQPGITAEMEASYTDTMQTNMAPTYALGVQAHTASSVKGHLSADSALGLTQATVYANRIRNDALVTSFDGHAYSVLPTPFLQFFNNMWVAQLQHVFKIGTAHTVRLSGEYRNSSVNTTPIQGGKVHYDVLSGGAMWNWEMTPELTLMGALRYDSLDLGRYGTFPDGLMQNNAEWDRRIEKASYNAGLVWELTALDTLRLTTAQGVQLPSLYNLGGAQYDFPMAPGQGPPHLFVTGLPTLKPTTVRNHELAWDRKLPAIDGELRMAYFTGESRDISSDWGGADVGRMIFTQPANIGSSRTNGLEISASGDFLGNWRWSLGYINQDIDDRFGGVPTSQTFSNFEDVTPRHIGNASIGWTRGAWEVDAFVQYQSAHWGLRAEPGKLPGSSVDNPDLLVPISDYATANARVGYQWTEKMGVALSAQNLFTDEQKQTAGPKVERRIMGTFTLNF